MALVRMVNIRVIVKVSVSVKSLRVRVRLRVSVSRVRRSMGWKIKPVMYIFVSPGQKVTSSIWFWVFKYFIQYYYKLLCVLVHRCLNGAASQYLSELIQPLSDVDSRRRLRSVSTAEVLVWATWCSTIGDRAFTVAGPRSWNNLPVDLRLSWIFITFKTYLKSHLFNLSFPSV